MIARRIPRNQPFVQDADQIALAIGGELHPKIAKNKFKQLHGFQQRMKHIRGGSMPLCERVQNGIQQSGFAGARFATQYKQPLSRLQTKKKFLSRGIVRRSGMIEPRVRGYVKRIFTQAKIMEETL